MYECPICNRTLGKIDRADETEFYCNRCKINSISFPEPNAYDKFCERIKNNREIIIKSKQESSKISKIKSGRVDINVLKAKLQDTESKELKKNIFILTILIFALVMVGVYLSL